MELVLETCCSRIDFSQVYIESDIVSYRIFELKKVYRKLTHAYSPPCRRTTIVISSNFTDLFKVKSCMKNICALTCSTRTTESLVQ